MTERIRVEGEVTQVLGRDDLDDYQVHEDMAHRIREYDEVTAVIHEDSPDTWLGHKLATVGHLLSFGRWSAYEWETVQFPAEDAPEVGDHVELEARQATVEVPLNAVEPIPDDLNPSSREVQASNRPNTDESMNSTDTTNRIGSEPAHNGGSP